MKNSRSYEASFKAKIALEGIRNIKSTGEICSEYNIPSTNLYDWRDRVIARCSELFVLESEQNKKLKSFEHEIDRLHKIIGELTVENSFMKKKLVK
jgi:transposase-like protein